GELMKVWKISLSEHRKPGSGSSLTGRHSTAGPRHRFLPTFVQPRTLALPHLRLEAFLLTPLRGDLSFVFPEINRQPRHVGRADRGCFRNHRTHHRNSYNIGLELAEEVVAR